jgi:hypothetical protein
MTVARRTAAGITSAGLWAASLAGLFLSADADAAMVLAFAGTTAAAAALAAPRGDCRAAFRHGFNAGIRSAAMGRREMIKR